MKSQKQNDKVTTWTRGDQKKSTSIYQSEIICIGSEKERTAFVLVAMINRKSKLRLLLRECSSILGKSWIHMEKNLPFTSK